MKKESVAEYLARGGKIRKYARGVSFKDDGKTKKPIKHGQCYAYLAKGCRCTACVVAWRKYQRDRARLRREQKAAA